MLDTDGQRPTALGELAPHLAMVQVTVDFTGPDAAVTHAVSTLAVAAGAKCRHALVLCPKDDTTDAQMLRIVEQVHTAAGEVEIIIHPHSPAGETPALDRRWSTLLEHAVLMHSNCRLVVRVPPPTGLR
jgi:hypothetical protein